MSSQLVIVVQPVPFNVQSTLAQYSPLNANDASLSTRVSSLKSFKLCLTNLNRLQVFRHPDDLGITLEYLGTSFLVKNPSCGPCLMTAFADVTQCKT